MTALTPGCDPDMSITGAPYGAARGGPRVRSGLVLLAVVAVAALLAAGDSVPSLLAVPVLGLGVLCALVLVRRGIRLGRRGAGVAAARAVRALHRSRPVPTGMP
jgi:hypothetical protein